MKESEEKARLRDFLQNEVLIECKKLDPLRIQSFEAFKTEDCEMLKRAVEGLLIACFGDGVCQGNIRERFQEQVAVMDACIEDAGEETPQPGNNSVVETHILFTQRILAAFMSVYVGQLEKKWLDLWGSSSSDFRYISMFHEVITKYISFLTVMPALVALRSLESSFSIEWYAEGDTEGILLDQDSCRATICCDLLQPKENLMAAFETAVDRAKAKIKAKPENEMICNLYDFPRAKDGRRRPPPYSDWYRAIIDYEAATGCSSVYQAAQDYTPPGGDTEATRKNFENRIKRFYSLLDAVMTNNFPHLG